MCARWRNENRERLVLYLSLSLAGCLLYLCEINVLRVGTLGWTILRNIYFDVHTRGVVAADAACMQEAAAAARRVVRLH